MKIRILLVEDDPGHQCLLGLAMGEGRPQVAVSLAGTRAEFVAALSSSVFDCIVMDYNLGDCRADELLQYLQRVAPDCPAIVVSSSPEQSIVIQSLRNGGADFLPKSEAVEGDRLWRRIELALEERRRQAGERRREGRRRRRLVELAEKDPLTGLGNRRHVHRLLRADGRGTFDRRGNVTVVMADIDEFKRVNDTHGHGAGDIVLRAVADLIREVAAKEDAVCRWGGEEFLVLRASTTLAEGVAWAEALRATIARTVIHVSDATLAVTTSFGLVNVPSRELSNEAIEKADRALLRSKHRGRNRVTIWQLVQFEELAREANHVESSPRQRLLDLLHRCHTLLGPTQREHLTSHAEQVSRLAVRIGRTLGLPDRRLQSVRMAGLCHDLGKFLIPEEVLVKPARLSDAERALLARHPADSADMSLLLGVDDETADGIRHHHDRFDSVPTSDGSEAAALPGRILNVADAFVTMRSWRPYQAAKSVSGALSELRAQSGRQFDPEVVNAAHRAILRAD